MLVPSLHKIVASLTPLVCAGMLFFIQPSLVFASTTECTMSPFSKTIFQGEQVHFEGTLMHREGAQGMEIRTGNLPRNVVAGFFQPKQENPSLIDLYFIAGPEAQVGSFNVVLFFTERHSGIDFISQCLVNIVIQKAPNKLTTSTTAPSVPSLVAIPPILYTSIDQLGERTAMAIDVIALTKEHPEAVRPYAESPITTPSQSFRFSQRMRLGVEGTEVRHLQRILKSYGFFPSAIPETGYFGAITRDAVKKFQKENNIPMLGVVGPRTIIVLNNLTTSA